MDRAKFGTHVGEDRLEEYAFGRLTEPELGEVEEHLLFCEKCQTTLAETDDFRTMVKAGLSLPDRQPVVAPSRGWRRAWIAGLAAASVGLCILLVRGDARQSEVVSLAAIRGSEVTRMKAAHSAEFRIAAQDLEDGEYRIEVVNERGGVVWSGTGRAVGGTIRVSEPKALSRGIYWVRVSRAGSLLHEYGIEAAL